MKKSCFALAFGFSLVTGTASAAGLNEAKIVRIIDGKEVYIDEDSARINQTATSGSLIRTKRSRAELLFDKRAIGLLGRDSLIKLGARCFSLDSGVVVINGAQRACLGSRILGVRGTTYALAKENDDTYTLSVLAGESIFANELPESDQTINILETYPKIGPWTGVTAGGFGSVYPSGGGSFTGGLSYFTPLSQSSATKILYSSSSLGSSFQNLWGVSAELGYRWMTPSNQATSSLYAGYSGYGSPGCFSNLINAGAQWERARWRVGASGGLKVNDCPSGLSYGALNLSIPIGQRDNKPLYLSISPYILNGNVTTTSLLTDTNSSNFPGIRATIDVPVKSNLSVKAYTGADSVFGLTIGGYISYRIPTGGKIINDPNLEVAEIVSGPSDEQPSSQVNDQQTNNNSKELARLAWTVQAETVSDAGNGGLLAQTVEEGIIKEGQRGRFSASGELLGIESIPDDDFKNLLLVNFKGQNPLPESRRIAKAAEKRKLLSTEIAGILGTDFLNNAALAVSATVDTPFTPLTQMPTGRFVCAATPKARSIGAQEATAGEFNYSGDAAYFGKGSLTSQGYPATSNKRDAYVFSDSGVCNEINRLANQGYDVVQAESI